MIYYNKGYELQITFLYFKDFDDSIYYTFSYDIYNNEDDRIGNRIKHAFRRRILLYAITKQLSFNQDIYTFTVSALNQLTFVKISCVLL